MWRRFLIIFSVIVFLTVGFSARAYSSPGKPAGFVNDFAGILDLAQKASLETKINSFNASTSNEISVVIINSLDGDTIENYANKLFADWGIGKDKKDNGVLLLVSMGDRQMRIEPGYGLEGALPDITCRQIITQTMRPAFQAGDYYKGVDGAVNDIISATKGEYTADTADNATNSSSLNNLSFDLIFFLIFFGFSLLNILWRHLAKSRSWWEGGVIGFILGLIIAVIFLRILLFLILIPVIGILFGLGSDYLVSRVLPKPKPPRRGGSGGIWFGGGGFGGSGGGGGFGGFGGGGSGGGGSSGGW